MNGSSHLGRIVRQRGFTLIELLVAMGLFIIVVSLTTSVFISALRNQGRVAELMGVYNGASLALEQMMREMRTGREFVFNPDPEANECQNPRIRKLRFINTSDLFVRYFLCEISGKDNGIARSIKDIEDGNPVKIARLTGRNVFVDKVGFSIIGIGADEADPNDNADGIPPRVTISVCLRAKGSLALSSIPLCIQNTVTARDTDI